MPGKENGLEGLAKKFLKSINEADTQELVAEIVNRVTLGMDDGDRFYHAKDKTWWEWRNGRLMASRPPMGYRKGR